MNEKRLFLIILVIGILLLIAPVSAKEITSKVDDKHIQHSYGTDYYFIHTVDFGDVQVIDTVYNEIMINDTVTFPNTDNWGIYNVKVVK